MPHRNRQQNEIFQQLTFGVGVMLEWIDVPLAVYGTSLIIVLAFIGRFTAYAVRSVSASLIQLHAELEESARVFGYGPLRTFHALPSHSYCRACSRAGFSSLAYS